ncbi:hypothetical protein D3C75_1358510 [compost metagenome]
MGLPGDPEQPVRQVEEPVGRVRGTGHLVLVRRHRPEAVNQAVTLGAFGPL